jgi:hypothetical protein
MSHHPHQHQYHQSDHESQHRNLRRSQGSYIHPQEQQQQAVPVSIEQQPLQRVTADDHHTNNVMGCNNRSVHYALLSSSASRSGGLGPPLTSHAHAPAHQFSYLNNAGRAGSSWLQHGGGSPNGRLDQGGKENPAIVKLDRLFSIHRRFIVRHYLHVWFVHAVVEGFGVSHHGDVRERSGSIGGAGRSGSMQQRVQNNHVDLQQRGEVFAVQQQQQQLFDHHQHPTRQSEEAPLQSRCIAKTPKIFPLYLRRDVSSSRISWTEASSQQHPIDNGRYDAQICQQQPAPSRQLDERSCRSGRSPQRLYHTPARGSRDDVPRPNGALETTTGIMTTTALERARSNSSTLHYMNQAANIGSHAQLPCDQVDTACDIHLVSGLNSVSSHRANQQDDKHSRSHNNSSGHNSMPAKNESGDVVANSGDSAVEKLEKFCANLLDWKQRRIEKQQGVRTLVAFTKWKCFFNVLQATEGLSLIRKLTTNNDDAHQHQRARDNDELAACNRAVTRNKATAPLEARSSIDERHSFDGSGRLHKHEHDGAQCENADHGDKIADNKEDDLINQLTALLLPVVRRKLGGQQPPRGNLETNRAYNSNPNLRHENVGQELPQNTDVADVSLSLSSKSSSNQSEQVLALLLGQLGMTQEAKSSLATTSSHTHVSRIGFDDGHDTVICRSLHKMAELNSEAANVQQWRERCATSSSIACAADTELKSKPAQGEVEYATAMPNAKSEEIQSHTACAGGRCERSDARISGSGRGRLDQTFALKRAAQLLKCFHLCQRYTVRCITMKDAIRKWHKHANYISQEQVLQQFELAVTQDLKRFDLDDELSLAPHRTNYHGERRQS